MRAAFAAAALILAGTAAAQAQSAPVDQSSPAPAATPAGQTNPPAPQQPTSGTNPSGGPPQAHAPVAGPTGIGHFPVLDIVTTFTQPAYYATAAQIKGYDPVDVGGTVRIPVTRRLNLLFDRVTEGTINQPTDCILTPSGAGGTGATVRSCGNATRDIILQYHATYAFDRYVTLDVGDSFRHRVWATNGGGVSSVPYLCNNNGTATGANCSISSTEHHYGFAGLSYTTKPWKDLWNSQFSLAETVSRQNVDHHVAMLCTAPVRASVLGPQLSCPNGNGNIGYYDENPSTSAYWETTQGVTWILPVDARHGTTFTLNERWGTLNWYENPAVSPITGTTIGEPYRWASALTYQLNKRFSPGFTISLRHSDFHSLATQGTPYFPPNAIHVGSWDVLGTFHLDTNSWFH